MAVRYTERPAPAHLAAHVSCAWTLEAGPAPLVGWRVVPDGHMDLVAAPGEPLRLAGPATRPTRADLPAHGVVRGLRLRPGGAHALLGVPAEAVRDATVTLAELGVRLPATPPVGGVDALVEHVLARLDRPGARTAALAADAGVSERQLLRRFRAAVGLGPAAMRRVLRLQRVLALAAADAAPQELAELAAAAGYVDQAHMTGDVAELCGLPPAALLRERQVEL